MFETYSSSANQSAVEKLIQLATGKKTPAWAEEAKPAAPEAIEPPAPPVEAEPAHVAEEPPAMEAEAETPAEVAREAGAEDSHEGGYDAGHEGSLEPPHAAMIEEVLAEAEAPLEAEQEQGEAEPRIDETAAGQPFHEWTPERVEQGTPFEAVAEATPMESVSERVSEPVAEATVEQSLVESPAVEPESVQVEEVAAEMEPEIARHTESPFEAAVQPDRVYAGAPEAAHAEEEVGSAEPEQVEPVTAAAESAGPRADAESWTYTEAPAAMEAVDDRPFHTPEPVAEPDQDGMQTPSTDMGMGDAQRIGATEPAKMADSVAAAFAAQEVAARAAVPPASERLRSIPRFAVGDPQAFGPQSSRRGADVVPSPGETTYLRSKGGDGQPDEITEEELRQLAQDPMWKTLVQFKAWLPVVTRVLPLLDMARNRPQGGGVTAEMQDAMEGLLVSHKDVRATLQGQTTELKRVEDEVAKLRDAMDKTTFEQTTVAEDMRSTQRMVKNASMYMGILLGLLVAVVGYMAFLVFTYLNHPAH